MDLLVKPPSPVEDGLGGKDLPYAEGDDHNTTKYEHGNDPASLPAVCLQLGEVEGQEEHEETTANEEETKSVDINQESPNGGHKRHRLVGVGGDETFSLCPPLVDGESEDDGDGSNWGADAEETRTPAPVSSLELGCDLWCDGKVNDVRQTDETDGNASPLGGDVVGKNDLLHDLHASVTDGIKDSSTSEIASGLGNSNDDETDDPEKNRDQVGLSATEDICELGDRELANSDENSLNDSDGGVSTIVFELGGGRGLPSVHGVVVETSDISDEGNAQDADPEGPVSYTSTSFSGKHTDLFLAREVLFFDSTGIPVSVALDVLDVGSLRHDRYRRGIWKGEKGGKGCPNVILWKLRKGGVEERRQKKGETLLSDEEY